MSIASVLPAHFDRTAFQRASFTIVRTRIERCIQLRIVREIFSRRIG